MNAHLRKLTTFALVFATLVGAAAQSACARPAARDAPKTLTAFGSEEELKEYLTRISRASRYRTKLATSGAVAMMEIAAPAADSTESITNTQHAGVDEGGIVKLHGRHLVVLRRGRLFTVDVSDGRLQPISAVNAFGPEMNPDGAWYDELLVSDGKVVVIGYSYPRQGSELGLFDIDAAGRLKYRATYQIRSNDYYSTRNYASRLIGTKLILYSPLEMPTVDFDKIRGLPGIRKWDAIAQRRSGGNDFVDIATAATIYRIPSQPPLAQVLHTVTVCDLAAPELSCKATALSGNRSRVFYVSPRAVYVWTGGWAGAFSTSEPETPAQDVPGTLFRMPLDGSAPQAIGVRGTPVDQLSFDETEGQFLNVVTRSESAGEWMGKAETAKGEVELLHLPLTAFGDGTRSAPRSDYRSLPVPPPGVFHSRFVRGSLLYGSGTYSSIDPGDARDSRLFVADPASGFTAQLPVPHHVDRIEVMGEDAVVIGSRGGDLHFSGVQLGAQPTRAQHYVMRNAAQGETRTHGFFYKPTNRGSGLLALPVLSLGNGQEEGSMAGSAAVVFLQNTEGRFAPLGRLNANSEAITEDECEVSCFDWYGNARPIFAGGRILALMGYEIVEGRLAPGAIEEIRRTTFAPPVQRQASR